MTFSSSTSPASARGTNKSRKALAKAWRNYLAVRRAYCNGKATVQELAHALALVGVAEAQADLES